MEQAQKYYFLQADAPCNVDTTGRQWPRNDERLKEIDDFKDEHIMLK